MSIDLSRQENLIHRTPLRALVIGVGAIGSSAVEVLTKMGIAEITIYDGDLLGPENAAGGVFDLRMLGKSKVRSVKSIVALMTGVEITKIVPEFYEGQPESADIVILGVDSLEKRARVWESLNVDGARWLIDGRIGGHNCTVFTVPLDNKERIGDWLETLKVTPDPLPCGSKTTAYIVKRVSSAIGNTFRALANDDKVPFMQHWQAEDGLEFSATV